MSSSPIHPNAQIGSDTSVGFFVVIEQDVVIGTGCHIGHHAVILSGARLGDGVTIGDHSVVGRQPMRAANSAVTTDKAHDGPFIGARVRIGTGSVIYAGCTLEEDVFVADLATVREQVSIGEGTIIGRGAAVENQCSIGKRCKIETNAYITAYSTLGDHVFVAPGVLTSNDNFIGRTQERFDHFKGVQAESNSRLGVGSVILPGVRIGEEAVIAAGALQTQDASPETVYKGLPSRQAGAVPSEQLNKNATK